MSVDDLARRGFGSDAAAAFAYERGRPGYAPGVVELLSSEFDLNRSTRLLDIAAGTGHLSRLLAPAVGSLLAVEPSAGMRAVLQQVVPTAEVVAGRAERLPLDDDSVDAVVVGNAFHWFQPQEAAREIARVLRPRGPLALLFNTGVVADPAPSSELDELLETNRSAVVPPERREGSGLWRRPFTGAQSSFEPLRHTKFDHVVPLTRDGFLAYLASLAFVEAMPKPDRDILLARARELLPANCRLTMRTDCYLTRRR
jgi:SAM-dependent methyltransferase